MKKGIMVLIGLSILLLIGACGGESNYVAGELSGEELYEQSCLRCHGAEFDRIGRLAPVNEFAVDEISNAIINGRAGMPAGLVKDEDVLVLSEWLAEQ